MNEASSNGCDYKSGTMKECMPLALAYVPMQQAAEPAYDPADAIKRGTLFPGLDLPFMNIVNTQSIGSTPLAEVMTLQFVCHELQLYLDTHPKDTEAFQMLKEMLLLSCEAKKRYTEQYGPLCPADLANCETYSWLEDPWPWLFRNQ